MQDLVTFGDSVHWGQGHLPEKKFVTSVAAMLGLRPRMLAHSGATIGVDTACSGSADGEVPFACPTILQQVRMYPFDTQAAAVVLVNGGINDISVQTLINPSVTPEAIRRLSRRYCHVDMAALLRDVLQKFGSPQTRVIVTSYFPIFSSASDFSHIAQYLEGNFIMVPQLTEQAAQRQAILERVVENTQAFWTESTAALRDAVRDVACLRVQFAHVPFKDENAMFAPKTWLWEVHLKGFELVPEDPVAAERRIACNLFHSRPIDRATCYIASAGHPNLEGSAAFAEAIVTLATTPMTRHFTPPSMSGATRTPLIDLHAHPALDLRLPERPCDSDDRAKRSQLLMDAANRFGNFQRPFDPFPSSRYELDDAFDAGITVGSVLYNPADEVFGPCEPFVNLTKQRVRVEGALSNANYRLVTSPADLKDAIDKQQPAAFHCIEGGYGVGDPSRIEDLARAGVAYIILAHLVFREVAACVNALPFLDDDQFDRMFSMPVPGLTSTGVEMCEQMVQLGILPDITHMTETGAEHVFAIARRRNRPVIVSHGAPRGRAGRQYKLNLSPQTILSIRDSGGVVGVIFYDHWLLPPGTPSHAATTIGLVIEAMKRIREVAGTTECIAIGSDLEGFIHPVSGLEHVGKIRDLEAALVRDGSFSSEETEGILWKNAFRTLSLGWG